MYALPLPSFLGICLPLSYLCVPPFAAWTQAGAGAGGGWGTSRLSLSSCAAQSRMGLGSPPDPPIWASGLSASKVRGEKGVTPPLGLLPFIPLGAGDQMIWGLHTKPSASPEEDLILWASSRQGIRSKRSCGPRLSGSPQGSSVASSKDW